MLKNGLMRLQKQAKAPTPHQTRQNGTGNDDGLRKLKG
jgi:hypothetical protein